jgi:hypothetical protein
MHTGDQSISSQLEAATTTQSPLAIRQVIPDHARYNGLQLSVWVGCSPPIKQVLSQNFWPASDAHILPFRKSVATKSTDLDTFPAKEMFEMTDMGLP